MAMAYPGRLVQRGERDPRVVRAVKTALNRALALARRPDLRLDPDNPRFGPATERAVELFQARHVDAEGRPLKVDGVVGSITWAVLFGDATVPVVDVPGDALLARVLDVAAGEERKAVREVPRNSNRGPEVDQYLRRAGVPPGYAWCCAFTYWCFDEAAHALGRANPMVRTGGCLDHWNRAPRQGAARIAASDAVADPSRVRPGMLFVMDFGGGAGHTGLVESVRGGFVTTIEGNTDASRTREGGGVYRLTRKLAEINKGFIDYRGVGAPAPAPSPAPAPARARRAAGPRAAPATKGPPPPETAAPSAKRARATSSGTRTGAAKPSTKGAKDVRPGRTPRSAALPAKKPKAATGRRRSSTGAAPRKR